MSQQPQRTGKVRDGNLVLAVQDDVAVRAAAHGNRAGRAVAQEVQTVFLQIDSPVPEDDMSTMELAALEGPPFRLSLEYFFKRCFDIIGALVLALVFSPLIAVILVVMKRSGGSPIFRHTRVGLNGDLFECLKFRTMVPNADQALRDLLRSNQHLRDEWDRDHKLKNDPRVTRMGSFLRRTSLDELPQLWNVMRGEMSLVGPRPVTREELLRYGRNMVLYMMVKPGITGLWQVSGRNTVDYRRRVAIDVCYVRNQSLLLDLWILFKTTLVVVGRRGAY